jgi:hypothetical protein
MHSEHGATPHPDAASGVQDAVQVGDGATGPGGLRAVVGRLGNVGDVVGGFTNSGDRKT